MPKTLTPSEDLVMISLRLPTSMVGWLEQVAIAAGQNRSRKARELIEDAHNWFGLPAAMVEAFKQDARDRGIPMIEPREYVRELLSEKFVQMATTGKLASSGEKPVAPTAAGKKK